MDAEIKRRRCTCSCHYTLHDPDCAQCDGSSDTCTRDARLRKASLRHTFDVGAIPELDEEVDDEI